MDASDDQTVSCSEAQAVIAALSAMPHWGLSVVDTCPGRGDGLSVRRRFGTHRFEATVPPAVRWSELMSTLALIAFLIDADDALAAPGDNLARVHRSTANGISAAARDALGSFRASVLA
jgi:hypothetical protein